METLIEVRLYRLILAAGGTLRDTRGRAVIARMREDLNLHADELIQAYSRLHVMGFVSQANIRYNHRVRLVGHPSATTLAALPRRTRMAAACIMVLLAQDPALVNTTLPPDLPASLEKVFPGLGVIRDGAILNELVVDLTTSVHA